MEDLREAELIIETTDERVISQVEKSLQSVDVTRARASRIVDPVTILGIAAGTLTLINQLMVLRENLKKWKSPPHIRVRGISGKAVDLVTVDRDGLTDILES